MGGFFEVIDRRWIAMFAGPELQMLISGIETEGGWDVDDLRRNGERRAGGRRTSAYLFPLTAGNIASTVAEKEGVRAMTGRGVVTATAISWTSMYASAMRDHERKGRGNVLFRVCHLF